MNQRGAGWAALLLAAVTAAPAQEEPLGRSAAFGVLDEHPKVSVRPGTALRSRPDPRAEALILIPERLDLPVLERHGEWIRTHFGDWSGWLAPAGEPTLEEWRARIVEFNPMVIDTSLAERAAKVAQARELLGDSAEGSLGRWPLYTDVADARLLAALDRVADQVPAAYAARFGLRPATGEPPAVVIYAGEDSYRRFTSRFTDVSALDGGGHADAAMAALYVGDSDFDTLAAVLVHELTHLLNREVFVTAPRTWLEEGMANDLGLSRIHRDGRIELATLGGRAEISAQRTRSRRTLLQSVRTGGQGVWARLALDWRERRGTLIRLPELLDLPWSDFVADRDRAWNYAQTTFFVRYLLDVAPAGTADSFRTFVRAAAAGAPSNGAALAEVLDREPADLQREFERWLTRRTLGSR